MQFSNDELDEEFVVYEVTKTSAHRTARLPRKDNYNASISPTGYRAVYSQTVLNQGDTATGEVFCCINTRKETKYLTIINQLLLEPASELFREVILSLLEPHGMML